MVLLIDGYTLPLHFLPLELSGSERQKLLARDRNGIFESTKRMLDPEQHHSQIEDLPYAAEIVIDLANKPDGHFAVCHHLHRGHRWRLNCHLFALWVLPNGRAPTDKHLPFGLVNSPLELVIRNLQPVTRTEVNKLFPL